MNKKLLSLAVAAAMVTPIAANADVRVSGVIQAEVASLEVADGNEKLNASLRNGAFEDMDRQTLTNDSLGSILNEGPNHIQFDIDEKLGGGVSGQARYTMGFNTSGNFGFSPIGEEAWVGLGAAHFHVRYGTLTGAYKSSHTLVDPLAFTSLQTRGTGGGMSGENFNRLIRDAAGNVTGINVNSWENQNGLTNEGFVEGALELGVNYSGFSATLQGIVDDTSAMDGAGLFELRYTAPGDFFTMWLAGAYQDVSETTDRVGEDIADIVRDDEEKKNLKDDDFANWKIGGAFNLGPMVTLGLQYEDSEIGNLDNDLNTNGGKYILGSLEVTPVQNISIAGWVAGYLSDIDDMQRMIDSKGDPIDEDALSWAVAAKYHFSTRTMLYTGYRQTDSDNDFRDENIITLGLRHTF
jgi:predicted porin